MTAPPQPRKRTKTFTGCWTCRARKIKCDEAKPFCKQCRDKGFDCEGYSARLQWLTPVTGQRGTEAEEPQPGSMNHSLRRLLPIEPPQPTLKWGQIDDILCYLDSLELVVNSPNEDVSASIKNFGVFSLTQRSVPPDVNVLHTTPSTCMSDVFEAEVESEQIVNSDPDPGLIIPGLSNETSDAEAAWNLCNLHEQRFDVEFPHDQDFFPANTTVSVPSDTIPTLQFSPSSAAHEESLNTPNFHFSEVQDDDPTSKPHHDWALVRSVPDISVSSPQEQFLMSHYSNRVVNLFCVIDNAKSPWKTIHLPRVLQCVGELSLGATTTRIRNALRKSLLSISAFCLSNDHRTNNRSTEAEKWSIAASRYRCDAIGLLKYAVETDLYADNRPKYKEFLSTMLSMVTINVMSGDTSTCSVHLDGAEKLISHMNIRKSIFSRKAKSLHRIYLYLRVIYESTAVRPMRIGVSRFSPSLGCHKTFGPQPVVRSPHFPIEDEEMPSSTIPMAGDMGMDDSPLPGLSSYECIYGIPQCLLLLLKESIEVIDEVTLHRTNSDTTDIPEPLVQICDDLEQKIMDWPLEERLNLREDFRTEISATIIYHQTRAFINALIIFFSQGVRLMSYRYLRQYVQKVLESIEAIEQIKAETKVLAAPLFWPAFMGATEAFEPTHQERFRRWYARVEIYGIEAARTGIKVVHEVWRQGPPNYRQMHTGWRGVVRQRDECLMLT